MFFMNGKTKTKGSIFDLAKDFGEGKDSPAASSSLFPTPTS
jgi:hypothetical protein